MEMKQQRTRKKSKVCSLRSKVSSPSSALRPRTSSQGFTLLELMTVMVIMFILMGMSTLALRGVIRGAGISGAVSNVRAVLTQGRQQAIANQRPTAVVFATNAVGDSMTVVARYGKAGSGSTASVLVTQDDFAWSQAEMQGATVYNMRTGGFGTVNSPNPAGGDYQQFRLNPAMSTGGWSVGDEVGLVVGATRYLPDGVEFVSLSAPNVVIFNPDGSARAGLTLSMREKNVAGATLISVLVDPLTGRVTVGE